MNRSILIAVPIKLKHFFQDYSLEKWSPKRGVCNPVGVQDNPSGCRIKVFFVLLINKILNNLKIVFTSPHTLSENFYSYVCT